MTRKVHLVLLAIAMIVAAIFAVAWISARRSARQLAATISVQDTSIKHSSLQQTQRDAQASAAVARIVAQKRQTTNPAQAAAAIPALLAPLPLPISIEIPSLSASGHPALSGPQAAPLTSADSQSPAIAAIPQQDLKPIYDQLQDCRVCAIERDTAKRDLLDEHEKVQALTRERDAAVALAHGGNFWTRLKYEAKWFLIGAAAGAVTTKLSKR